MPTIPNCQSPDLSQKTRESNDAPTMSFLTLSVSGTLLNKNSRDLIIDLISKQLFWFKKSDYERKNCLKAKIILISSHALTVRSFWFKKNIVFHKSDADPTKSLYNAISYYI